MPPQKFSPYNPGSPVKPSHFVGRAEQIAEIRQTLTAAKAGYPAPIFVRGEWGIGKTSLLKKLEPEFREHGVVIREDVLEGDAAQQHKSFFLAVIQELRDELQADPLPDFTIQFDQPRSLRKMLTALIDALWSQRELITVIVLDNLERARAEFLVGVKDIFMRVGEDAPSFVLVFAGKSLPGAGEHASDPIARFFQPVHVGPMVDQDALEAIQKPIQMDAEFSIEPDAARLIQERAEGHPYFLKQICHHVYVQVSGQGRVDAAWLKDHWSEIESGLEKKRFGGEFEALPEAESRTLLLGSLHGPEFPRSAIAMPKKSTLDTSLRRLVQERGLLRAVSRGVYRFYHPLFFAYVRGRAEAAGLEATELSARALIEQGEGDRVEFKETLEWCVRRKTKSDDVLHAVLKTVAAFGNSRGGTLLIGVSDDGTVAGLERDLALLAKAKRNRDQFTLKLQNLIRSNLKPEMTNRVRIRFEEIEAKDICIVEVPQLAELTFLNNECFVRDGPQTLKLEGEQIPRYLDRRQFEGD